MVIWRGKLIYMQQLEGFVVKGKENVVCKLTKSLYGLRQAPNNGIKYLALSVKEWVSQLQCRPLLLLHKGWFYLYYFVTVC